MNTIWKLVPVSSVLKDKSPLQTRSSLRPKIQTKWLHYLDGHINDVREAATCLETVGDP